jgi:enoyl-CoA hydratase/carnithine racemase
MVDVAQDRGIAVVRLDRGVINALNPALVLSLGRAVATVREDDGLTALVLSSANDKFFSIGLDIPELLGFSRGDFARFLEDFDSLCLELITFPKPVIAALRGHATAGGCILALCCDYRLIADGRRRMGLNESRLGVPVPYPADCALRWLVGARTARDVADSGEFFLPPDLLRMGLVDEVWPGEEVETRAVEKARTLAEAAGQAFPSIKRSRVEGLEAEIRLRLGEKQREFVEAWYSPAARARLEAAIEKFREPGKK